MGPRLHYFSGMDRYSDFLLYFTFTIELKLDGELALSNAYQICFSDGAKSLSYAYYGQGSGDIFMDDVQCVGTETNIGHCPHISVGMNDCGHYEDAGVWCTPGLCFVCLGFHHIATVFQSDCYSITFKNFKF